MTPERPMETKEEPRKIENHTTEAPASMTFKVMYKGIEVLVTNRDTSVAIQPFLDKAQKAINWALENGFEAPPQRNFFQKKEKVVDYVEGRTCPTDGGKLIKKTTKDGKTFVECENRKYDFTTRTTSGCSFIEWSQVKKTLNEEI